MSMYTASEAASVCGLSPGRPSPPDVGGDTAVRQRDSDVDTLSLLREQVSELRRRAEVAEALAAERERVLFERDRVIEVQSRALLMLENRPAPAPPGVLGRALRRLVG
jgi:hypothetical protein